MRFHDFRSVQSLEGSFIVLTKNGAVSINGKDGREMERYNMIIGSRDFAFADGSPRSRRATRLAQWDPYNVPILTEKTGQASSSAT